MQNPKPDTTVFRLQWKISAGVLPRQTETSVLFCCEQMKDTWGTFVGGEA